LQDATPLTHLHHIATVVSDAHQSTEFYTETLGLSVTAAPGYDLAFADGFLVAYVRPHAPRGRWGLGTTHHVALLCETADDQDKWKRWLVDRDHSVTGPYDRQYFRSIYFTDPDGLILEIATRGPGFSGPVGSIDDPVPPPPELTLGHRDEEAIRQITWPEPVDEITDGMRLQGLHHVTCISDDERATDAFYTDVLALHRAKITINFDNPDSLHLYYTNEKAEPGSTITFFGFTRRSMRPGRLGTGVVDHIAFTGSGERAEITDPSGLKLEIA
jgi:glyoxalase family protein